MLTVIAISFQWHKFQILDIVSDQMAFGALLPCPDCGIGLLEFRSGTGYCCTKELCTWAVCGAVYEDPNRVPFQVPSDLKIKYKFL